MYTYTKNSKKPNKYSENLYKLHTLNIHYTYTKPTLHIHKTYTIFIFLHRE